MIHPETVNTIIFGAAVLVMCLGSYDVVREANATSVREFFEALGESLIGRLTGWWLIASFILMLLHIVP